MAGYIVLDTQLIIGGKNAQMEIGIDDYCLAGLPDLVEMLQFCLAEPPRSNLSQGIPLQTLPFRVGMGTKMRCSSCFRMMHNATTCAAIH